MNPVKFIGKKSGRIRYRFDVDESEYMELNEENGGACIRCGAEAYGVEPDARKYECENCGELGVYGLEELLIMGYVNITGTRNERINANA